MNQPILEALSGKYNNYMLPFLWLHGEAEAVLRDYMRAIDAAGIKAVCLESRPHPDFLGPRWWHDLDILLDEAKKRKMKLWILDDRHYPTGSAAGAMEKTPIELQKQFLGCNMVDVYGAQKRVKLQMDKLAKIPVNPHNLQKLKYTDDTLYAVIAAPLNGTIDDPLDHVGSECIDLTPLVSGEQLVWDVPGGMWRIFTLYLTHNGPEEHRIHLISSASCKVLLDTVYEAHYARYASEFGNTIAGFFSDEPAIGNALGKALLGETVMNLPWSSELEAALRTVWGADLVRKLPALFAPMGKCNETAVLRVQYMDSVSELVRKCFSEQIGDWCRARNVEYIGHIIEDNYTDMGLGAGNGHFFRSLWGQDMAGIDDIGSQITMGGMSSQHLSFVGRSDGVFYHHVLGKLGSSLAHLDPKKKDRCLCECFGAYGWSEGTQLMKYILDHLLADGVTYFVPHAFNAAAFPDWDCPPHFYAGGQDILFPFFGKLMEYGNRLSHVLSSFRHRARVALLYPAESVWAGDACENLGKCARILREHQIDFDIVPADLLFNNLRNGLLTINGRHYEALAVPGCKWLPKEIEAFCEEARMQKFPVYFGAQKPENTADMILSWQALADRLMKKQSISITGANRDLRIYYGENGSDAILFAFNTSTWEICHAQVIDRKENCYCYDAMENRLYRVPVADGCAALTVEPTQSRLLWFTDQFIENTPELPVLPEAAEPIRAVWKISTMGEDGFVLQGKTEEPEAFELPGYSGVIRYECEIDLDASIQQVILELPQVRETAEVSCNDQAVGCRIAAPFRFDLTDFCRPSCNTICIDVTTTMEQKVLQASGGRDFFTSMQKVWNHYGLGQAPVLRIAR